MSFPFETFENGSFSKANKMLQTFLDSSSLNEFKVCPRRYYYSIVYGFQPAMESVHLTFGTMLHRAVELYWTLRLNNQLAHREAQLEVIKQIMIETWDKERNRPWDSDNKAKNRYTLIRTIVWYLDKYQDDPIQTVRVGNSDRLAVELPFRIGTGYKSATTGEEFILCGRLDRIGELNGARYVTDVKTTQHTIGEYWFAKFTPDNQFTIYTIAARNAFGVDTEGILVDACQVVQSFSVFARGIVQRTDSMLDEWHRNLGFWLEQLEDCAFHDNWPMNDSACGMYGGCPFRQVCAAPSTNAANLLLKTQYKRRVWDPTFERLDY
jgi:hypothetical protein